MTKETFIIEAWHILREAQRQVNIARHNLEDKDCQEFRAELDKHDPGLSAVLEHGAKVRLLLNQEVVDYLTAKLGSEG